MADPQKLAKVDDVIHLADPIPDNVDRVTDEDGASWQLQSSGLWFCVKADEGTTPIEPGVLSKAWGPLTVTAVRDLQPRPRLARVGDRIEHGEAIPANVVALRDADGDTEMAWWRVSVEPLAFYFNDERPRPGFVGSPVEKLAAKWFPMTVVEVDPEPQSAEARCCDGMVRYNQHDRYCPARDAQPAVEPPIWQLPRAHCYTGDNHAPHAWKDGDEAVVCWGEPARDPNPAPTADPGTFADCVAWLIAAGLGTNADRRIDRMAAQHQELQARYDTVVSDRATVKASLELVKERIREHQPADPDPLVLTLPQVPDGAVALVGLRTGTRYEPEEEVWRINSWYGDLPDVLRREHPEGARVEMAPPREPRTWPKIDKPDDDDLPQVIDVEGHGRWRRCSVDGVLFTDGESGTTMGELMTWGDVREVLDNG